MGFCVFHSRDHNFNFELHLRHPWALGLVRDEPKEGLFPATTSLLLGPLSVTHWRGDLARPFEPEDWCEPEEEAR